MNRNRKLVDMRNGAVSNSAWRLLRFIVASNTSYLKQIDDEDELIQGIPKEYRQFRLVVGSPAKEHLLNENVKAAQARNANSVNYPTLFAWHGEYNFVSKSSPKDLLTMISADRIACQELPYDST